MCLGDPQTDFDWLVQALSEVQDRYDAMFSGKLHHLCQFFTR